MMYTLLLSHMCQFGPKQLLLLAETVALKEHHLFYPVVSNVYQLNQSAYCLVCHTLIIALDEYSYSLTFAMCSRRRPKEMKVSSKGPESKKRS